MFFQVRTTQRGNSVFNVVIVSQRGNRASLFRAAPPELCQVVLVLLRTLPSASLSDEARLANISAPF